MRTPQKPDRTEQISFMAEAPERTDGYVRKWLADPGFKAALHRYDREHPLHRDLKKVARG